MAERRRNRKKKEQTETSERGGKPSKEEYAIAKYMRQKLPEKKTMLLGHKVDYFIAARAIDCLLDSPWATKSEKQEAIFTNRESCIDMMDKMLHHKFFHRAKKIVVQKDSKKKKKERDEETVAESSKEKEQKEKKEKKKETKANEEVDEKEKVEEKKEGEKEEKKKEKRKIKLDMHMEQLFIDGNEAYVWIYDPIPMRTWIIGMLMVAGAVLVCLFPLWPQSIRHYIYYLSVAAAFFLVFIIGLALVRLVIFVIIWVITLGNHHLWLLPNLTEDVGFFESFWPLYHYEYRGTKQKKESKKKGEVEKAKKQEDKSSSKETKEKSEDKSDSDQEKKTDSDQEKKTDSDQEKKNSEDQMPSESEQDSDDTEKGKADKENSDAEKEKNENGDNGFEILDPEDEVTAYNNNN